MNPARTISSLSLLNTRFQTVAENTIDYWMKEDNQALSMSGLTERIEAAPWLPRSTLQIYLHVPYCAQRCSFCAFSGGNSLSFKTAAQYADLLIWQLKNLVSRTQAHGKPVVSVNIGGGSPDLLKGNMARVLEAVRRLPGVSPSTEISVEFALSTVTDEFLDTLAEYRVTKASFGIQVFDPRLRSGLRMPAVPRRMEEVCDRLAGRVPIINLDLMTGFPGQTITMAMEDLEFAIGHPVVNSISTYLLTPGAAPQLIADIQTGRLGQRPDEVRQALLRVHSYSLLQRAGWVRKGTNTYMSPAKISREVLSTVGGNECIGARRYEDFLIGCGPQAVSSLPGVRLENVVDIADWMRAAEAGEHSFALPKCSLAEQRDMALWVFPLMADGLCKTEFDSLIAQGVLDNEQRENFEAFCEEGLILLLSGRYRLSITGEVFMGHLVRQLKKSSDQKVIEDYVREGYELGESLAKNRLNSSNAVNNRQISPFNIQETGT